MVGPVSVCTRKSQIDTLGQVLRIERERVEWGAKERRRKRSDDDGDVDDSWSCAD